MQIDHTKLYILLCSEEDRNRIIGRPTLTICFDVASRAVLSFRLSFEAPSTNSLMMAFCDAIAPKPNQSLDANANSWPFFGLPKMVHTDNGTDLVAKPFTDGLAMLGIEHYKRPIGAPNYGGHVERIFRTINSFVHTLLGSTRSNVEMRKYKEPENTACLSLHEMRLLMLDYFSKDYHLKVHSSLGCSPIDFWRRYWSHENTSPQLPQNITTLRKNFLPCSTRKIGKQGIRFCGLDYRSEQLQKLRNLGVGSIRFKYDPEDIRRIFYFNGKKTDFEIPCTRKFDCPISVCELEILNRDKPTGNRVYLDCDLSAQQLNANQIIVSAKRSKAKTRKRDGRKKLQSRVLIPVSNRF